MTILEDERERRKKRGRGKRREEEKGKEGGRKEDRREEERRKDKKKRTPSPAVQLYLIHTLWGTCHQFHRLRGCTTKERKRKKIPVSAHRVPRLASF